MRLDRAGSACSFLPVPVSRPSWPFPSPSRHENKKEDRQRQGSPRQVDIDRSEAEGSHVTPFRVILLPGSVLPAELAYGSLVAALGSDADAVAKDLEVYATKEAPLDYDLDLEVAGVEREAAARGWERFHLVGYSGGGAAALAVVARHPERLSSLALLEPAWAGRWDLSPAEQSVWREYDRLEVLPPDEFMRAFMRLNVRPGVEPPPPALWRPSALDGEASRRDQRIHSDVSDLRPRSRCSRTIRSTRLLRARRAEQPRSVRRDRDPTQRGLSRFST